MYWANFLHLYQPKDQQQDIMEAIVEQSYRPILNGIKNNNRIRLTLNINGTLLELFDKYGYRDLIDILKELGEAGRVEFTSSSKCHAFLPLIGQNEIFRQIKINNETNKFYLGKGYQPRGFFPPEMAYSKNLLPVLEDFNFKWIILDEIACAGEPGKIDYRKIYKIRNSPLLVFFRERRLSNLIMSAIVRSKETLKTAMKEDLKSGRYLVTAMDAETFGHHRPGLEKMLFDVFSAKEFNLIQISDIAQHFKDYQDVSPIESTWASSVEDIKNNIQFLSWNDPENIIHKLQWDFLNMVLKEFYRVPSSDPQYPALRNKIDDALSSDSFWWASAKPWWSLEMIEIGAWRLLETIKIIPNVQKESIEQARNFYTKIISTAFNWQRTGRIREMMRQQRSILRIPFKDRTLGRGGAEKGVYHAFIDMMKKLEKTAAKNGEYEKAILWRDSIYKLEKKLDIYDTINAIDILRTEIPHKKVEAIIEKYKNKYRQIRGGQPEQRGN